MSQGSSKLLNSFQSAVNSTVAALTGAATFTGTWELNDHTHVSVFAKADVAGTLYCDFSHDGSTLHSTFPVAGFAVGANIYEIHTAVKLGRYFRVRYVNGAAAQSSLFVYTQYCSTPVQLSAPMNQSLGLDTDATIVRTTSIEDEIRLGFRSGVVGWNKFGYRTGLTSAGGEQTIWATTGNMTFLTTASTFTIAYDGTAGGSTDGAGTSGATELYFYYIDSTGLPAITAHTLETDGSDVTAFSGLGINRIAVSTNGGDTYNASAITVTATTGGTTQAYIPAQQSVTQQAVFFNGSNHTAIVKYIHFGVTVATKTAVVVIKGYVYNRQFDTRYEVFRTSIDTAVELTQDHIDPTGFVLNSTDVLYFIADSDSNSVDITCRFSISQYQIS